MKVFKMLVITDNNQPLAESLAKRLGLEVFALRHRVSFDSLSMEQALRKAISQQSFPVVIADQSDNPGGGAPGDSTYALRWLLDHQVQNVAMAIFYDPEVVQLAIGAGVGATLSVRLGRKMGPTSGDPIELAVKVGAVNPGSDESFCESGVR